MHKPQLCLTQSFGSGWSFGTHISIRRWRMREPEVQRDGSPLSRVLYAYGCPDRVAAQAMSCLWHSGRYDCTVTTQALSRLERDLGRLGYDLLVEDQK